MKVRRTRLGGTEIQTGFSLPPSTVFAYTPSCAVVVVEGAIVRPFLPKTSTMLVIGLVLSVAGIGCFRWLLFRS